MPVVCSVNVHIGCQILMFSSSHSPMMHSVCFVWHHGVNTHFKLNFDAGAEQCSFNFRTWVQTEVWSDHSRSFGQGDTWPLVIADYQADSISSTTYATRKIIQIAPTTRLATLIADERTIAAKLVRKHSAFLALVAIEPTKWILVRFKLWRTPANTLAAEQIQAYNILHVTNLVTVGKNDG